MAPKTGPKKDNPEQSERFEKTAREIGADEDPKAFDREFMKRVKPSAPRSRPSGKPASS
jgi:hypothetical protein